MTSHIQENHKLAARKTSCAAYYKGMTEDERIERHVEICQRVYERLVAEGKWLWPDSPKSGDMLESECPKTDV